MSYTNVIASWTRSAPYLQAILSIVAAFIILQTGTMKLVAWPGGIGISEFMSQTWIGGVLEAFGGGLLMLGLFTRPVAFILSGEMAVAYFQFHQPNGIWPVINGGVSSAVYCFLWQYYSAAGAGAWSLDARRSK